MLFPVYLAVKSGLQNVDRKSRGGARTGWAGAGWRVLAGHPTCLLHRPAQWPGPGLMFVVAAELMGATKGLGFLLVEAR
ncbi:MAG: hypothetical protein WKG07_38400, partial [Hymenobacter sp.]